MKKYNKFNIKKDEHKRYINIYFFMKFFFYLFHFYLKKFYYSNI